MALFTQKTFVLFFKLAGKVYFSNIIQIQNMSKNLPKKLCDIENMCDKIRNLTNNIKYFVM